MIYNIDVIDLNLTWEIISWLQQITTLKIVLKGILSVEDVLLAMSHNVNGIWISNHGGRQLDTVPAPIQVLYDISRAIKQQQPTTTAGTLRNQNTTSLSLGISISSSSSSSCNSNTHTHTSISTSMPEIYIDGGIMRGTDVFKVNYTYIYMYIYIYIYI